jgi:homoserine acetyltransferase
MLNVAQKKLTAVKKLVNAESKEDMQKREELMKELVKELNAEIRRLQEFASAYGHGSYHTKTRRQAPNIKDFTALAIKHGFDADEHIKIAEYEQFGWNA